MQCHGNSMEIRPEARVSVPCSADELKLNSLCSSVWLVLAAIRMSPCERACMHAGTMDSAALLLVDWNAEAKLAQAASERVAGRDVQGDEEGSGKPVHCKLLYHFGICFVSSFWLNILWRCSCGTCCICAGAKLQRGICTGDVLSNHRSQCAASHESYKLEFPLPLCSARH